MGRNKFADVCVKGLCLTHHVACVKLEGEHVNQLSYNVNVNSLNHVYLAGYKNVGYSINGYNALTIN